MSQVGGRPDSSSRITSLQGEAYVGEEKAAGEAAPAGEEAAPAPAPSKPSTSSGSALLERQNDPLAQRTAEKLRPGRRWGAGFGDEEHAAARAAYRQARVTFHRGRRSELREMVLQRLQEKKQRPPTPQEKVLAEAAYEAATADLKEGQKVNVEAIVQEAETHLFYFKVISFFLFGELFSFFSYRMFSPLTDWLRQCANTLQQSRTLEDHLFGRDPEETSTTRAAKGRQKLQARQAGTPATSSGAARKPAVTPGGTVDETGATVGQTKARAAVSRADAARVFAEREAEAGETPTVASVAPGADAAGAAAPSGSVRRFRDLIQDAARRTGVPAGLIAAVMHVESGGNPKAASRTNDRGLMQINGDAHPDFFARTKDPLAPKAQIDYGADVLAANLRHFGGDARKAVAAYNAGIGGVERVLKRGLDASAATSAQRYVPSILGLAQRYEEEMGLGKAVARR